MGSPLTWRAITIRRRCIERVGVAHRGPGLPRVSNSLACHDFPSLPQRAAPRMTARCVMVLGTSSGAGKSWLATALCRWYARQGLRVAPFKAQNMSNNARVVALPDRAPGADAGSGGGEIGSAQYFQALAARARPEVRHNPLLLKPERDTHSQVVLLGRVSAELTALPWRGRSERVWPVLAQALDTLRAENDVVVIEGAGSPAEINLMASDIVNLRVARHAGARCLLVADIDRGGAFAHLYGTWALLSEADRALLRGFVLNKFRGDVALLAPAPAQLEALTGVPTVATLPMWRGHGLPEEDGMFDERGHGPGNGQGTVLRTVAVVAYPRISNLDEFQPLKNIPGLRLAWAREAADLASLAVSDWVVLPGSKHTSGDLAWLRAQGLDGAIAAHAARGGAVLGVCGGLQMLGEALIDPHGIDGNAPGLGLLPLVTLFEPDKTVRHRSARFGALAGGAWVALSGLALDGYEIHHGQTAEHPAMAAAGQRARAVMADGLAWQNDAGNVLGLYLHGLFESPRALQALFGAHAPTLDSVFDGLADRIDAHFAPGVLRSLIE
ncbi:MAG: cobalamin biosynthesis protein CobQ [Variovorax sp.]|nr:cobalamin biosynthesis protein CobQ [Variovorax sp.]